MATFVLVHGSWAGSVVWRQLAPRLRKAGHEVYAPTLTGIGERKHLLNREIDLDTHIQDVIGVIDEEDLSDIVLVGNSYGGMVISGVADRVPEKVASLVYLDAFVPENGQSLFSLLPPGRRLATVPGEDWLVAPIPSASFGLKRPEVIALCGGEERAAPARHPHLAGTADGRHWSCQTEDVYPGHGSRALHPVLRQAEERSGLDGAHLALHYFHAARNARRTDSHPAEGDSLEGVGPGPVQDSLFCRRAAPQQLWRLAASRQPQLSLLRAK
jgi:pimeloyl-ACP methyl ester carboxylesterase